LVFVNLRHFHVIKPPTKTKKYQFAAMAKKDLGKSISQYK